MMVGRRLIGMFLIALMAVGSILLWLGIPVGVLYAASRLVKSSQPSMGVYVMILIGIPLLMVIVGKLLSRLNRTYANVMGTAQTERVTLPWHRSMRGERDAGPPHDGPRRRDDRQRRPRAAGLRGLVLPVRRLEPARLGLAQPLTA